MNRRAVFALALAAAVGLATFPAHVAAQAWPSKPIRLIVPYPPGGPVDTIARLLANGLQKELGQPIVVDNKPGASGLIGITATVQGEPDGYTFGFGVLGILAVLPTVGKMPFKMEDVNYVTLLTQSPHVLAVNPDKTGVKDLKQFIEAARKQPGKMFYGSPGTGSSTHLDGELLQQEAKIEIVHVPYKGGSQAITALVSGEIQLLAAEISAVMPMQQKLKIVAVMGNQRSAHLPEVPTTAELGYPNVIASSIYGIIAPTKTPKEITEKFRAAVIKAINSPEVKAKLDSQGQTVTTSTPEEYRKLMADESKKWGTMIKTRGIKLE